MRTSEGRPFQAEWTASANVLRPECAPDLWFSKVANVAEAELERKRITGGIAKRKGESGCVKSFRHHRASQVKVPPTPAS